MRWQAASGASLARHSRGRRTPFRAAAARQRSEEHTSELQSRSDLVCRLLLEKKKKIRIEGNLASYEWSVLLSSYNVESGPVKTLLIRCKSPDTIHIPHETTTHQVVNGCVLT